MEEGCREANIPLKEISGMPETALFVFFPKSYPICLEREKCYPEMYMQDHIYFDL